MAFGLRFEAAPRAVESAAERADVACFVGFVALRDGPLPASVWEGWRRAGWRHVLPGAQALAADPSLRPARPLPVRVDNIEAFDALFDGWVRAGSLAWEGPLAGAVRDFFRQGGQRCHVVPVGPPAPDPVDEAGWRAALEALVPGSGGGVAVNPGDRDSWRGLGHVLGLPDVALVCLPDLPFIVGAGPGAPPQRPPEAIGAPVFAPCAPEPPTPPGGQQLRVPGAPRLDDAALTRWQRAVGLAVDLLQRTRRDVQLLAALPLLPEGSREEADPMVVLGEHLAPLPAGVGSARVQLAWPWLKADTSADRRGGLAAPDGALAGVLARSALARGAFRLAVDEPLHGVRGLEPVPTPAVLFAPRPLVGGAGALALVERVCVFTADRRGFALRSDVTASADPTWRQGGVNRLMGVVLRALQVVGEAHVFDTSGPEAWWRLRRAVEVTLDGLVAEGALGGRGAPYQVRCDRTTMRQSDLDAGRLICEVALNPTLSIERIIVTLSVSGGARALVAGGPGEA